MKKFLSIMIVAMMISSLNAATLFVSSSGDNSDGTSWNTAFQSIQAALDAAVSGDEVWVKQGTYVIPDSASQLLFVEGVDVYGGFAGDEAALNERSEDPSLTIVTRAETVAKEFRLLRGEDLNELTTWDGFTFDGNNNGPGVVLAGNCVLQNSVVQNCLITNGSGAGVYMTSGSGFIPVKLSNTDVKNNTLKANSLDPYLKGGAGINVASGAEMAEISNCDITGNTIEGTSASGNIETMGAGIRIFEGQILNCLIDGNELTNSENATYASNVFTAAGIAIIPGPTSEDANNLLVEGCVITNNVSPSRGGAVIIDPRWSGDYHGNFDIKKTVITNNESGNVGGGILTTAPTAQPSGGWTLNLENCLISNNSSGGAGGGVFINASHTFNVTNSTIVNNYAAAYGGAGIFMQGTGSQTINASFRNVLLWGNVCPGRDAREVQLKNNNHPSTIIFNAIQDFDPAYWQFGDATVGDNVVLGTDNEGAFDGPHFLSPSSDAGYGVSDALTANWRITTGSACIDWGDDYLTEDLDGTARPQGDYSDIGAYEYDPNNPPTSVNDVFKAKESFTVYSSQGNIVVDADVEGLVSIFNITGSLMKTVRVFPGETSIPMRSQQLYIVRFNGQTKKVVVK